MKHIFRLLLLLPLLVGCTQLAEQRQFHRREAALKSDYTAFLQAVQQAASARICVTKFGKYGAADSKRVFVFPAAEFQNLRIILSHTKQLPISREEPQVATAQWACSFQLQLLDAGGRVLCSRDPSVTWTSETRMLNLPVNYRHTIYDPTWYLPDADFLTMIKLPTMRAASQWSSQ